MSFPLGIAWAFPVHSKLLSRPQTLGDVMDMNNVSQALCRLIQARGQSQARSTLRNAVQGRTNPEKVLCDLPS